MSNAASPIWKQTTTIASNPGWALVPHLLGWLPADSLRLAGVAHADRWASKCLMRLLLNLLNRNEAGDHCKSNSWIDLRVPAPALCCRNGLRHEPRSHFGSTSRLPVLSSASSA